MAIILQDKVGGYIDGDFNVIIDIYKTNNGIIYTLEIEKRMVPQNSGNLMKQIVMILNY